MKKLVKQILFALVFVVTLNIVTTKNTYAEEHKHTVVEIVTKATAKKDGSVVKKCTTCNNIISKKIVYKVSNVSLSKKSYTYNGKTKKPGVIVKNSKGKTIPKKYYKVVYSKGRKNIGKYTVAIKFKGRYKGTKKLAFTIRPKKIFVQDIKSAVNSMNVLVKYSNNTGYEIQYSKFKDFSKATTKTFKYKNSDYHTYNIFTGMEDATQYYIRVRAYKTIKRGGKKINIYSHWSKTKNIKTIKKSDDVFITVDDKDELSYFLFGLGQQICDKGYHSDFNFEIYGDYSLNSQEVEKNIKRIKKEHYFTYVYKTKKTGYEAGYNWDIPKQAFDFFEKDTGNEFYVYGFTVEAWRKGEYTYYIIHYLNPFNNRIQFLDYCLWDIWDVNFGEIKEYGKIKYSDIKINKYS